MFLGESDLIHLLLFYISNKYIETKQYNQAHDIYGLNGIYSANYIGVFLRKS